MIALIIALLTSLPTIWQIIIALASLFASLPKAEKNTAKTELRALAKSRDFDAFAAKVASLNKEFIS